MYLSICVVVVVLVDVDVVVDVVNGGQGRDCVIELAQTLYAFVEAKETA